jgi:hypothetical protein
MDDPTKGTLPDTRPHLVVERHGNGGAIEGQMYFRDGLVFIGGEIVQHVIANLLDVDPVKWTLKERIRITVEDMEAE